ncbi:MAG TPA: hypothetical protein ENN63_11455 [Bacteroidetes bacterium]|nr:hypothetical protein [Bacteroidota bacterium]
MASRKELKRQINRLTYELISDAFQALKRNSDLDRRPVMDVIGETVDVRNRLIGLVNHPEAEQDTAQRKKDYRKIREEMVKHFDRSFTRLSQLLQEEKKV